ncbi:hypothetical protein [Phyllobacterium bourgognense]|uniref:Hsp20/alpha crystallin family protein n=1 Tax=Phyllobacterium bourgognense TaxID=314236 RepID=A0A368YKF7_9HYPH|nr:hypothetical protein C7476_12353 [Phyllobacterium bourgognense]
MSVRDLIPWSRGNKNVPRLYRDDDLDPFLSAPQHIEAEPTLH